METKINKAFANRKVKVDEKSKKTDVNPVFNIGPFETRFGKTKMEEWKQQHGNRQLICLSVGNHLAVLRPPTADDIGEYMTAIGTNGLTKAVAMVMEQLWIEGDASLIDDEDEFIAVFLQVNNILEGKKAEFFRF
jgi:hypothetical protein